MSVCYCTSPTGAANASRVSSATFAPVKVLRNASSTCFSRCSSANALIKGLNLGFCIPPLLVCYCASPTGAANASCVSSATFAPVEVLRNASSACFSRCSSANALIKGLNLGFCIPPLSVCYCTSPTGAANASCVSSATFAPVKVLRNASSACFSRCSNANALIKGLNLGFCIPPLLVCYCASPTGAANASCVSSATFAPVKVLRNASSTCFSRCSNTNALIKGLNLGFCIPPLLVCYCASPTGAANASCVSSATFAPVEVLRNASSACFSRCSSANALIKGLNLGFCIPPLSVCYCTSPTGAANASRVSSATFAPVKVLRNASSTCFSRCSNTNALIKGLNLGFCIPPLSVCYCTSPTGAANASRVSSATFAPVKVLRNASSACFSRCSSANALIKRLNLGFCIPPLLVCYCTSPTGAANASCVSSATFAPVKVLRNASSACFSRYSSANALIKGLNLGFCIPPLLVCYCASPTGAANASCVSSATFAPVKVLRNASSACFSRCSSANALIKGLNLGFCIPPLLVCYCASPTGAANASCVSSATFAPVKVLRNASSACFSRCSNANALIKGLNLGFCIPPLLVCYCTSPTGAANASCVSSATFAPVKVLRNASSACFSRCSSANALIKGLNLGFCIPPLLVCYCASPTGAANASRVSSATFAPVKVLRNASSACFSRCSSANALIKGLNLGFCIPPLLVCYCASPTGAANASRVSSATFAPVKVLRNASSACFSRCSNANALIKGLNLGFCIPPLS